MKVYVVEGGQYSDRWLAGAFSSEDLAAAYVYAQTVESTGSWTVYEMEVDEEEPKRALRRNERVFSVTMTAGGEGATAEVLWREPYDFALYNPQRDQLIVNCWAISTEEAIKIANERRTAWRIGGSRLGDGHLIGEVSASARQYGWREALP